MDHQLLKFIQDSRIVGLDPFFKLICEQTTSITIGAIAALIFMGLIFKQNKRLTMVGMKTLVVILINATVVIILKNIIQRARPFDTYDDIIKLSSGGSPSFPSGHTAEVFALAFSMLFILKNKTVFYLFLAWAILIGYSRMSMGVHYPSDVLVGALIGGGMAYFINFLLEKYLPENSVKENPEKEVNS
ncbi:MAG: phosphatase PAP2 family protein [Crocinitomicaceae bacterium]